MNECKRIWEMKQSVNDPDTLEMYIYGDIEGDYFDWWTWEMKQSETSANFFRSELAKYPDVKNINIYVNSFGGLVDEAMAIRSQLKRHPAAVTGYVDGFACSAATVILTGCDKVIMYSNAMQMIHNMWRGVAGNSMQLRKAADDLDVIMEGNRQAYLQKSNGKLTEENLIDMLNNETWLTAKQCLEYGLCDEIYEQETDLTKAKQMLQKFNQSLNQQLSYNRALTAQIKDFTQGVNQVPPKMPKEQEPVPPNKITNAQKLKQIFNSKNLEVK